MNAQFEKLCEVNSHKRRKWESTENTKEWNFWRCSETKCPFLWHQRTSRWWMVSTFQSMASAYILWVRALEAHPKRFPKRNLRMISLRRKTLSIEFCECYTDRSRRRRRKRIADRRVALRSAHWWRTEPIAKTKETHTAFLSWESTKLCTRCKCPMIHSTNIRRHILVLNFTEFLLLLFLYFVLHWGLSLDLQAEVILQVQVILLVQVTLLANRTNKQYWTLFQTWEQSYLNYDIQRLDSLHWSQKQEPETKKSTSWIIAFKTDQTNIW